MCQECFSYVSMIQLLYAALTSIPCAFISKYSTYDLSCILCPLNMVVLCAYIPVAHYEQWVYNLPSCGHQIHHKPLYMYNIPHTLSLPWWSWTLLLSCKFLAMGTLLSIMNAYKLLWTMKDWVYLAKLLANGIEIKLQNKVYWSACSMHAHTGDLLSSFPCYIQCIALGIYIKTCPAMRQDAILKNEGDCFKHMDPIRIYHSMMDTSLTLCLQLYMLYSCLCTIKHAAFRIMFS